MEYVVFLLIAFAASVLVGVAICHCGSMADDHAEECFRDTAEQRTQYVIDTVRRQQWDARSWNQEFCRDDLPHRSELDEWADMLRMEGVAG